MEKHTEQQLMDINVLELRTMAAGLNILYPSKKNKVELVKLILGVESGEITPDPPMRRGRPPKDAHSDGDSEKPVSARRISTKTDIDDLDDDDEEESDGKQHSAKTAEPKKAAKAPLRTRAVEVEPGIYEVTAVTKTASKPINADDLPAKKSTANTDRKNVPSYFSGRGRGQGSNSTAPRQNEARNAQNSPRANAQDAPRQAANDYSRPSNFRTQTQPQVGRRTETAQTAAENSRGFAATAQTAEQSVKSEYDSSSAENAYRTNGVFSDVNFEAESADIDAKTDNGAQTAESQAVADVREGLLEINSDGYGFLRVRNCEFNPQDVYVPIVKIKRYGLRAGDKIVCTVKSVQENKPVAMIEPLVINGLPPEKAFDRPKFDDLIPIYPDERYKLEIDGRPQDFATRSIDLVAPIGRGQRAIIVSPPKAGKTTLLKMIATSIMNNYPSVELFVLLVDERPEEVTDMKRSIKGEVIYSTFDEQAEHHTKAAELLLARAKRLVELGKDVVILLDSLTRLARAYNLVIPPTGRTLSGGIDPGALHSPKRFFGSARNIEGGGSLTIIATALVDTGSRMDDVIYEEFKGTGNMEIHLDRKLSERRIFPAIDLAKSGTRREELLLTPIELEGIWGMRKYLSSGDTAESTETLLSMLVKTKNNREFIEQLNLMLRSIQNEGYVFRKTN